MRTATEDEIAEILGDRAEETIVERIANVGASIEEIEEALQDFEHEVRYGEHREASSPKIEELHAILEELPRIIEDLSLDEENHEDEGLRVIEADELGAERY